MPPKLKPKRVPTLDVVSQTQVSVTKYELDLIRRHLDYNPLVDVFYAARCVAAKES